MDAMQGSCNRHGGTITGRRWRDRAQAALPTVLLGAACIAAAPTAHAHDEFAVAVQRFRDGRASDAYGRFLELAINGDADAARIALFMLRHGPILYGSHWDASTDDVEYWQNLAASGLGRAQPVYRPPVYAQQAAGTKKPRVRSAPQLARASLEHRHGPQ